jgi:hypothetical protein
MTMSYSAAFDADVASYSDESNGLGFFARIQAARIRRAERAVQGHLVQLSDEHLAKLGFGPGEIVALRARATGPQPVLL